MKESKTRPGERLIKRYLNRKLYDAEARRHVTLDDLAGWVAKGEEVRVVDQRTGDDLTPIVLAQVLLEGLKQRTASIPHQVLTRLIRLAHGPRAAWTGFSGPAEAATRARDEAERIASGLLAQGRLTLDEAVALRQEMAASVQRIVAEAQRGLEERLRGLVEHGEDEHGVNPALQTLKSRLLSFESQLDPPPLISRKPVKKPRRVASTRRAQRRA